MVLPLSLQLLALAAASAFDDPPPTPPPPAPVPEVEPNQTRETATPAVIAPANLNAFKGVSRGFVTDAASTADNTRDMWRVTLPANPLLVQRHRLQLATDGTQGHTASIMGVTAAGGVVDPASMVALQNTSINTVPARFCQVYTLGAAAPSILYRLTGSSGTTQPYTVTVATETVTPLAIRACPFRAGTVTISTVTRTALNTKVLLFNADTLAPIEGALNDDTPVGSPNASGGSPQSTLTRTLMPGRYLLAIGNTDTVDTRVPPADDRASTQPSVNLTDGPGLLVNGSSTASGDFSFSITDSLGENFKVNVAATKPGPYGIVFYKFETQYWCGPADIGSAGGLPCWNGTLDNNDFIVFINDFFATRPSTDIGKAGGFPGADMHWDNNDWIVYLNQYFAGCQ